jgi:hypothetical protein
MANPTITNISRAYVVYESGKHVSELLVFGGAGTVAEGTILARKAVATAITATADAGNTGDGTVTLATVQPGPDIPLVGDYTFTCTAAVTNGGVFNLVDPLGSTVRENLTLTVGAGATTVFNLAGIEFTVTDGATDFAADDFFTLTVAADGNMYPFATDGIGGVQKPLMVLTADATATGAGNVAIRPMKTGGVRKELLIIDADGDDSNITSAILDELRSAGIYAKLVTDNSVLDNQ